MRIFLAGGSGVIGRRLVPLLVCAGHVVAAMTRSPDKALALRGLGAEPVVCDVYDALALREAAIAFGPNAVIHQLTDLPDDPARLSDLSARNSRMRREGTANILAAASAAGAARVLVQSVAWELHGDAGAAVQEHERQALQWGAVVVRYGRFYGPGTYFESGAPPAPRIHVDEAARRTLAALGAPCGVIEVVEDPPAPR